MSDWLQEQDDKAVSRAVELLEGGRSEDQAWAEIREEYPDATRAEIMMKARKQIHQNRLATPIRDKKIQKAIKGVEDAKEGRRGGHR